MSTVYWIATVAELPAILDSFLTGVANTTSTPTGREGRGWPGGELQNGRQRLRLH